MTSIGVAISTCNRRDVALETVQTWLKFLPAGAKLVVVDDFSDEPFPVFDDVTVIRHPRRMGVASTKNTGLAWLMDEGCDHIFLADDDVVMRHEDWWQPYVNSPLPHLSYNWPHKNQRGKDGTGWPPRILESDDQHDFYSFPRGVLLYLKREAVEKCGGMNPAHGIFSGEHVEYSGRIKDAYDMPGFADVKNSDQIWYARDLHLGNTRGSSFPLLVRKRLHKANGMHYGRTWDGYPYMPYDEPFQDWSLGPRVETPGDHYALLRHCVEITPPGVALEFGVGSGESTSILASKHEVIGFDSGLGIPEDWRPEYPKGSFAYGIPQIPGVDIVEGWFKDTLPGFDFGGLNISLVHLDADLHSSTSEALNALQPHLKPGTVIVFDEYHGFEGSEEHEERAWREFAEANNLSWVVIGHGHEQIAFRLI